MKKTRRVEVLFTDIEYKKIFATKGDSSVSDYIRSLIKGDTDRDRKEAVEFTSLLQKLRMADFEKLDQSMRRVELALRDLLNGNKNQISKASESDKAESEDKHIRMIATILAVNARAVPGESKIFAELISDDFTVREPFDFILAYLKFFSEQRPYAMTHLKRLYPAFFKNTG